METSGKFVTRNFIGCSRTARNSDSKTTWTVGLFTFCDRRIQWTANIYDNLFYRTFRKMINGDQEPILSTSQDVALDIFGPIAFTTSTPSISTPTTRQSGRKSWFDNNLGNPGKGTKYEIAIEKRAKRRSRRLSEEEEMETLTLTHFTNPPRIGFGKATTGSVKKRNLLIKNPHEYPQDVKVEKFPFKKHFDIDQTRFTVEAEGTLQLTITWLPEEEGNFREMILFQVDGAYRLQAFVFGCVEKPPQKRKMVGLMRKHQY